MLGWKPLLAAVAATGLLATSALFADPASLEKAGPSAQPSDQVILTAPHVGEDGRLVYPEGAAIPKHITDIEREYMAEYIHHVQGRGCEVDREDGVRSSNCCASKPGTGCDDPDCQTLICNVDPYCCNVQWDALCAQQANTFCDACGATGLPSTPPPVGPLTTPAEFEPTAAIMFTWNGPVQWTNILATMGAQITTTGDADLIVYVNSTAVQNSATTALTNAGANMSRVSFQVKSTNAIWIRDYGPRFVYQGGVRVVLDHTYNVPRPLDNEVPEHFANATGIPYYQIPLFHGGGNYHIGPDPEGYVTRLIVNENPVFSESEIIDLFRDYWGTESIMFNPLPQNVDATQHIDMWMIPVSDDTIIISEWPFQSTSTQAQICDAAAAYFAGEGFNVFRVPARTLSNVHYTYTNAVIVNDLVLVPTYTATGVAQWNNDAISTWQQAAPGKTIVAIPSQNIISAAGALHCIVKHVPANSGGGNPVVFLLNQLAGETLDPNTTLELQWISDDDVAVVSIDLELSIDGGNTFDPIALTIADSGTYNWNVPDIGTTEAAIRITAYDTPGNTGSFTSDLFTIDGLVPPPPCPGDINGDLVVDLDDFIILAGNFGSGPGMTPQDGDLNGDGFVDLDDFIILAGNFGSNCN